MPSPESKTRKPTPSHLLIEVLSELCQQPEEGSLAYLLGVLLVRKRLLVEANDKPQISDESYMHLVHPTDGREFWVPVAPPESDQLETIHQALDEIMYRDQ